MLSPMEKADIIEWLNRAVAKSGKTQDEVADGAGMRRDALNKVLNGKRDISASELFAVARSTGQDVPSSRPILRDHDATPLAAPVIGIIAPGSWREAGALMHTNYAVPIIPDLRYEVHKQYALRYEGPRHSRGFKYGDFLIFIPIAPNGSNVRPGGIVHIERHNAGTRETTIRSVKTLPDHSYDLLSDTEGDPVIHIESFGQTGDVEVRGVYIGTYSPDTP